MFTGIVIGTGEIIEKKAKTDGIVFVVGGHAFTKKVKEGSSISVSGICLTVKKKSGSNIFFDVMPETLKKTTLDKKNKGDKVNLELTLKVGDEIGGHFVYGHVDGVGEVVLVENQGDNKLIRIKPIVELMKFIIPQGSVAVDGVSLTVASFDKETFTVSLIPFTLENTTFGELKVGDRVNIENDMLLKFIANSS